MIIKGAQFAQLRLVRRAAPDQAKVVAAVSGGNIDLDKPAQLVS